MVAAINEETLNLRVPVITNSRMQERAERLGGSISIRSRLEGTEVNFSFRASLYQDGAPRSGSRPRRQVA